MLKQNQLVSCEFNKKGIVFCIFSPLTLSKLKTLNVFRLFSSSKWLLVSLSHLFSFFNLIKYVETKPRLSNVFTREQLKDSWLTFKLTLLIVIAKYLNIVFMCLSALHPRRLVLASSAYCC